MSTTDGSVVRSKPGRKPRYTTQELERRTLAAAVDVVISDGVTAGVDAIRIEKVIIDAEAPRAATYDLWDQRGDGTSQQNLRRAAVIEIIRNTPSGNVQLTGDFAVAAVTANADRLATGDEAEIRAVRSELIRDVAAFNFDLLQDQRWMVYKTLTSSIGTKHDPELRAAVAAGEEALLASYAELFQTLADIFGLQLKPGYKLPHFTMSAYALNEGLSNRIGATFEDQTMIRDGATWTVFALGFEALVDQYFE